MSAVARVARLWNRFWFAEVDGRPLGAARIGVALSGLVLWAGMVPQLRHYYSDAGEWPIAAARAWSAEYVPRFLMPDALGDPAVVYFLAALWGASLVALLLGWRTRAAAWLNWFLAVWFLYRNATFNNGGDEVFRLVSLYLALGYSALPPAVRAFSLDRRNARGEGVAPGPPVHAAWPVRMIQIQIAVVYLVSGFWKVAGPPWWDGSALYYALSNPAFSRFGLPDAAWLHLPFMLVTLSVAWWEFLFWALVLLPRTRRPALLFGVALHLGILLTMSIGIFPFIMLGCYPVFLTGAEVGRGVERLRRLPGPDRLTPAPSG